MQMTHKHNKWLQILAEEDFPTKVLRSENADFKLSVNNKEEASTRNREAEGTSLTKPSFARVIARYLFLVIIVVVGKIWLKISEGHHTTPALTRIGSCMTFRSSLYKLTNRN